MALKQLIIAILAAVVGFFVIRLLPDQTLRRIGWGLLVVVALVWVIRNIDAILHCCTM